MIIIADSGSTKTDWRILSKEKEIQVTTKGYNPYYYGSEVLESYAKELISTITAEEVKAIYFYGSGCSTEANYKKVSNVLRRFFPKAICFVYHDLLASARAVLGDEYGIACILGTGSNSCLYNGHEILENVPSVGWMIGDEGSGTYLGKLLITDYMRFLMPNEIKQKLEDKYKITFEIVLNKMYSEPNPHNFFATFPPFILENIEHDYCKQLVLRNFNDFYYWQISQYTDFKNETIGFVGSIAYHFKEILAEWLKEKDLQLGKIHKNPMDGLIEYYRLKY